MFLCNINNNNLHIKCIKLVTEILFFCQLFFFSGLKIYFVFIFWIVEFDVAFVKKLQKKEWLDDGK